MTQQELKNCILILNDMEQNIYMMTRMGEKLDEEINKLRNKEYSYPDKPEKRREKYKHTVLVCIFMSNPIAMFLFDLIFDVFDGFLKILPIIVYVLLLPINIIVGIIYYYYEKPKIETAQKEAEEIYRKSCEEYEKICAGIERNRCKDTEKADALTEQKNNLLKRKAESESKLKEFYEKININEKFRGILPMSYMAEFIKLGIATKLEGADGLYYLVLKELKDTEFKYSITAKLDEAVQKEQSLHKELERMKRTCDIMMLNSANNASSNTIDSYQSERIARELEYQTYLIKKGIYG